MDIVVVGSKALQTHEGFQNLEPKDCDIWVVEDYDYKKVLSADEVLDVHILPKSVMRHFSVPQLTLDQLCTIKCSHLGWDNPQWEKHKNDILMMQGKGAVLEESLFLDLISHWKMQFGNKEFLSLNKDKGDFFNDYVEYLYDHDELHEFVAQPFKPIYTYILKDRQEVVLDKGKFDLLTYNNKIQLFKEEIHTICLERYLLNPKCNLSIIESHNQALKKTITNLTKNWACDYIVTNLKEFIKPDYDIYNRVMSSLNKEEVKMSMKLKDICAEIGLYEKDDINDFKYQLSYGDQPHDSIEIIAHEGGEGEGDNGMVVFTYKGKYYRSDFGYYSYDGFQIEDMEYNFKEVTPTRVEVTQYL